MTKRQTYRVVGKFLKSQGWEHVRTKGSHHIWKSEDGTMTLSLPVHGGEVSAGVVKQIQDVFPDAPANWN